MLMTDDIDYARYDRIHPLRWTGDALELLDRRKPRAATEYVTCTTSDEVGRGHPRARSPRCAGNRHRRRMGGCARRACGRCNRCRRGCRAPGTGAAAPQRTRPTAVNTCLGASPPMRAALARGDGNWRQVLEDEAHAINSEDLAANRHMGVMGAALNRSREVGSLRTAIPDRLATARVRRRGLA